MIENEMVHITNQRIIEIEIGVNLNTEQLQIVWMHHNLCCVQDSDYRNKNIRQIMPYCVCMWCARTLQKPQSCSFCCCPYLQNVFYTFIFGMGQWKSNCVHFNKIFNEFMCAFAQVCLSSNFRDRSKKKKQSRLF